MADIREERRLWGSALGAGMSRAGTLKLKIELRSYWPVKINIMIFHKERLICTKCLRHEKYPWMHSMAGSSHA